MSTTVAGGWPPSPANDPGIRKVLPPTFIVYNDPYDQKYHAVNDGSLGLPGVDIVNSDAATVIQNALNAMTNGGMLTLKNGTYPINSQINQPSSTTLVGEDRNKTKLQANSTISSVIGFSGSISSSTIKNLHIDANSKATNAVNWGQAEISAINRLEDLTISNSTGKAIVLDGNEDTVLDFCLIENNNADGVSWSIVNGAGVWRSTISNVPLTGTDLSGLWQLMVVEANSVLNTIDVGASNVTIIRDSYLANRQGNIRSTAAGGTNIVALENCYCGIGASNPNFISLTKLGQQIRIKDCYFIALDGTTTYLINVTTQNVQSSAIVEGITRSSSTIKGPENPTNAIYVFTRNLFSKGANGIYNVSTDETNKQISFYTGTQQNPATASTDYLVKSGTCKLTSTGGTGVSITLKDGNGTTVLSGAATITREIALPGYKINFGAFSVAPTLTVEWI